MLKESDGDALAKLCRGMNDGEGPTFPSKTPNLFWLKPSDFFVLAGACHGMGCAMHTAMGSFVLIAWSEKALYGMQLKSSRLGL